MSRHVRPTVENNIAPPTPRPVQNTKEPRLTLDDLTSDQLKEKLETDQIHISKVESEIESINSTVNKLKQDFESHKQELNMHIQTLPQILADKARGQKINTHQCTNKISHLENLLTAYPEAINILQKRTQKVMRLLTQNQKNLQRDIKRCQLRLNELEISRKFQDLLQSGIEPHEIAKQLDVSETKLKEITGLHWS